MLNKKIGNKNNKSKQVKRVALLLESDMAFDRCACQRRWGLHPQSSGMGHPDGSDDEANNEEPPTLGS